MLADIKPDILFIFTHAEPYRPFNRCPDNPGGDKSIAERSKCADSVYQELGSMSFQQPGKSPDGRYSKDPGSKGSPQAAHAMDGPCIKAFVQFP